MDEITTGETNAEVSTETTDSSATETTETTTDATASDDVSVGETTQTTEKEDYTPNLTYKVYDEEKQIPDWAKSFVTSKEAEENFRSLFSKADAVDQMTAKRERQAQEFSELQENHENIMGQLNEASHFVERGDLESFFKTIGLNENVVYQWVLDKLNVQNLPEDQRRIYDEHNELRRNNVLLERQNQALESNWQNQQVQTRTRELDTELAKPEVRSIAQSFDSRLSQPGAFKDECIWLGKRIAESTGQDVTAEQVVQEVVKRMGNVVPMQQGQQAQSGTNPPVIPNVSARNVSPTRKKPNSIEELRQLGASME